MARKSKGYELDKFYRELKEGKLSPVYLFYGVESFLTSQAVAAVQKQVLHGIPVDFNFDQFYGKECDPQQVVDSAMTLPMMAPRRLVVLKEAFDLKARGFKLLLDYLRRPAETTVLLMEAGPLPRRKVTDGSGADRGKVGPRAVVEAARKVGTVLEIPKYWEKETRAWIRGEVTRLGKTIDGRSVTYLLDMVGENLRELHSELGKVALFVGERKAITLADVEAVVSDVSAEDIYGLANAIGARDTDTALTQLGKLLESGSGDRVAGQILRTVRRHYLGILETQVLLREGLPTQEIARRRRIRNTVVWRWEKQELAWARRMTRQEVLDGLRTVFDVSLSLRTSRTPASLQLEAMVLRLCRR